MCSSKEIDEATGCSGIGHCTAYVMYVADATITEDVFFCAPIKRRATKELFKIVVFMKGKSIKLSDRIVVCTDESRVIARNKGLQALIKLSAPEAM